ncbi:hypothetical protein ACA910_002775 [Epithemia clementina (nom. ined.)]
MASTTNDDPNKDDSPAAAAGWAYIQQVSPKSDTTRRLLSPMTVHFPESAVTAILGPSGSGKTTLLSVLTDSLPSNVMALAEVHLPGLSAFVPQDDRLHGFYTCHSYMHHYARLAGLGHVQDLDARINRLLQQMGLAEQAHTIVGDLFFQGLSGGQKRRLSIALEALSEPQTLFLDEPTSGLDAESAFQVMQFLKEYVRGASGRRVILTIHQPSSFIWEIIDHAILLSKGRVMYDGARPAMEDFFATQQYPTPAGWNPADHYVTIVNDEFRNHDLTVTQWAERYALYCQTDAHVESSYVLTKSMKQAASMETVATSRRQRVTVVLELIYRYFLNLFFNPGILLTRIAMYTMLALMVGALFWNLGHSHDLQSVQSRTAILFYCASFFIFMSVAVLPFTVMERAIVDKEVMNSYYNPVYYQISQAISSIPGAAILAGITTLLIITMTKLNEPDWYFATMFLSLTVAEAFAQLISHVVPHFVIGMALLAGMYGFFMLVMGFMLVPSEFPNWLNWCYYIGFHTYAWRTFMYSEFMENATFTGNDAFSNGEQILIFYEIDDVDRGNNLITLFGYYLVVNFMACVVLMMRYHLFSGKIDPPTLAIAEATEAANVAAAAFESSHDQKQKVVEQDTKNVEDKET